MELILYYLKAADVSLSIPSHSTLPSSYISHVSMVFNFLLGGNTF